ncbi:MAG TPA: hypothetical protein VF163_01200 [Micromonosporaceae bacterium]
MLRAIIDLYATDEAATRTAIREMFNRYPSFRWAAQLPRMWSTPDKFRARLIHLSARDQGADTRDEILILEELCDRARQLGIDADRILDEVAEISSDVDRYGMGSMRRIMLASGQSRRT